MRKAIFVSRCEILGLAGLVGLLGFGLTSPVRAADIAAYGVIKRQNFLQSDGATASPDAARPYQITLFAEPADFTAITSAEVRPPAGPTLLLKEDDNYAFTDARTSQSQLNSAYAAGPYSFSFETVNDQSTLAILNVPADAFGTTPLILNFSSLASVNATSDLNLQWTPFTGGTAEDFIQVRIFDGTDFALFETGALGSSDALTGTAQNIVIPSGTFEIGQTYQGHLTFGKVALRDTASYAGALGLVAFEKDVRFTIHTTSSGGGSGGPALLFANPTDGATEVPVVSPIVFVFSAPMSPSQAIAWSGTGVTPTSFQYSWIQPNTLLVTYTGGLPGNTKITYTLNPAANPTGFEDLLGSPLATVTGSFTTGAGGPGGGNPNPCAPGGGGGQGSLSVFKSVRYVQSGSGAPSIDPKSGAIFSATLQSPTDNPVVSASLKTPAGTAITLANVFGRSFSAFTPFPTQAELDAAFPSGSYVTTVKRSNGATQTITLTLGGDAPVPQIANFAEADALNSSADFALRWNSFVGAAERDGISLSMSDQANHEFHAPDPCIPRALPNTATSIVIPRNTFATTGEIDGELSFQKSAGADNSISDLPGFAGTQKVTLFRLRSAVTPPSGSALRFSQPVSQANSILIPVTGQPLTPYVIESSTDLKTWNPLSTLTLSAAGAGELNLPRSAAATFVRGKSQ